MSVTSIVGEHDCFTINQYLCTEALGLSGDGRAGYGYLKTLSIHPGTN